MYKKMAKEFIRDFAKGLTPFTEIEEHAINAFASYLEAAQLQLERDAVSCECQQPLVDMRRYGVHCGFCKKQLRPSTS